MTDEDVIFAVVVSGLVGIAYFIATLISPIAVAITLLGLSFIAMWGLLTG